ncbi:5'(3')-deoxyribonucleotidase [Staphylococcus succinus]|uniref:Putative 5'(3')-deoxyribonucleotidase n=1 Tax=Staphylococcus succinus TaxID=61015 RepID=A0A9Q6HNU1_9STAP|nr:5'(3')-deoxyribonucleotidase [Staphylococcus succinus]MEB8125929.1 5'(3')-deoxyribonucleotidase [Staphylococcus succinus]MEB8210817.1 5'(3')-deoxyribonucleotidase [Staphylococcus succinus]PTI39983.1 5'(3')-deoxyribonucleotidase [Staphylococcus succinus]PTI74947.1 5'(3')-deoxyribonucleotidase [Staphylococcus succinus]PTJ18333.1 5'(3')-deoxyribonucleotidase [Staphylococcus succinus]
MTRKSIAIDMDEVLADTVGALINDVNKRTDLDISYDMLDGKKLRHAMPEHDGLLTEILREPGFFKKLEIMEGAQDVVKKLTAHYDVYIATAAMDVPTSFHDKYAWLREHFSFLDPQQFVFCGRKNIVKADYLIDDNPRQLSIFTGTPIMYTASHNIHDDRFARVNNWKDVENYFLGDIEYNI